jgi:hypothetical protein
MRDTQDCTQMNTPKTAYEYAMSMTTEQLEGLLTREKQFPVRLHQEEIDFLKEKSTKYGFKSVADFIRTFLYDLRDFERFYLDRKIAQEEYHIKYFEMSLAVCANNPDFRSFFKANLLAHNERLERWKHLKETLQPSKLEKETEELLKPCSQ